MGKIKNLILDLLRILISELEYEDTSERYIESLVKQIRENGYFTVTPYQYVNASGLWLKTRYSKIRVDANDVYDIEYVLSNISDRESLDILISGLLRFNIVVTHVMIHSDLNYLMLRCSLTDHMLEALNDLSNKVFVHTPSIGESKSIKVSIPNNTIAKFIKHFMKIKFNELNFRCVHVIGHIWRVKYRLRRSI